MRIPPVIIHFDRTFPYFHHPAIGKPTFHIYGKLHIAIRKTIYMDYGPLIDGLPITNADVPLYVYPRVCPLSGVNNALSALRSACWASASELLQQMQQCGEFASWGVGRLEDLPTCRVVNVYSLRTEKNGHRQSYVNVYQVVESG